MKIEHVHFFVEDATAQRDWFVNYLGFQVVEDYTIPPRLFSTGDRSRCPQDTSELLHTRTEVVKSGAVYFLLSSPQSSSSPVAEFLRYHPPGVADVAFGVEDVSRAIATARACGTEILQPIQQYLQDASSLKWGKIAAWGGLSHTLIQRRKADIVPYSASVTAIDHLVLNVPTGELASAVEWYEKILDFQPQQTFKIQTERSALHSQVMVSRDGSVKFPINEPASANSQIQEFLAVNRGAGIQHIALKTSDIMGAIALFRANGLSFLSVPTSYYSQLQKREELPLTSEELQALSQQEILIDWHQETPDALLLQIFTQPIFKEPTFFFEFIERREQAQGFGEGNFRALFQAIEREQIKRGSLQ